MTDSLNRITIEQCDCSPSCNSWYLVGIGHFCRGSGFTHAEAMEIATTLNRYRFPERQAEQTRDMVERVAEILKFTFFESKEGPSWKDLARKMIAVLGEGFTGLRPVPDKNPPSPTSEPSGYSVSASLVKALEDLQVTIKPTDSDEAMGYAATRNSVLNEAIAIARQDRFNPDMQLQQREIPDIGGLRQAVASTLEGGIPYPSLASYDHANEIIEAIRPYLRTTEPVSLKRCRNALSEALYQERSDLDATRAVVDAAGVKYVD